MDDQKKDYHELPRVAIDFIDSVIKQVRYRNKVRREVRDELVDHFTMGLSECGTTEEKETAAKEIIEEFGDVKMLGHLIRRGKKRCRPLFKKVIIRSFQGIGISFLCFILYCGWFFTGKPHITVDYLEVFNASVRPKIADADNAWPHYEKAAGLYAAPDEETKKLTDKLSRNLSPDLRSFTDEERALLQSWLSSNDMAWNEYSTGAEMGYCYREYGYGDQDQEDQWLISVLLPNLSEMKRLAEIGCWKAKFALDRRSSKQALDICVKLLKVSKQFQHQATLIEMLVGMAIGEYGSMLGLHIAAEGNLSLDEIAASYGELSAIFAEGYPQIDFEGERIFTLDVIQHSFTNGGPGGGHLVAKYLLSSGIVDPPDFQELLMRTGGSLLHAGRNKTIKKVEEIYDRFDKIAQLSPYEQKVREVSFDEMLEQLPLYRYMIIDIMVPALGRVCRLRFEKEVTYQAMLAVFAIKRWEIEKGALPKDLDELVQAGLLDRLPDDPYAAGSLVYRLDGENFKLYSAGRDFADDGGVAGTDKNGRYELWSETGDAVFWPVR